MPLVSKISFASLALLILAACSSSGRDAPPALAPSPTPLPAETIAKYRSDLRNTGVFALDSAPLFGELAWQFETGGEVHASPAYADGVLYAASYAGLLYALDAQSGAQLWQAGLPERTDSSPLVTEDSILIGTLAGLMVFDRQTGALRFGVPNVGYVRSSPLVLNGNMYFGSDDGHLYALDAATGDQSWAFPASGRISSSPAIWEEHVIFGDESGMLYALDAATGSELWRFPTEQPIFSSPAVSAAGVVYFGGLDGAFYALQAFSGDLFWRWVAEGPEEELLVTETPAAEPSPTPEITPTPVPEIGAPIASSAAVVDVENMVYFGVLDNLVYALDKDIGEMVWYFETGGQVYGSPVYAGGVLYIGSNDGQLYALDARTGELFWSYETGGPITGSPAMSDGLIYFGSQDGSIYALR